MTIYELSIIFKISDLLKTVQDDIISYFQSDLNYVIKFYLETLKMKESNSFCRERVLLNLTNLLKSDSFLDLDETIICDIFEKNNTVLDKDLLDFAIEYYTKHQKKEYKILDYIEYKNINSSDFNSCVNKIDEKLKEIISSKKDKSTFSRSNSIITGSSCYDIMKNFSSNSLKNGIYSIKTKESTLPMYCNFDFEGGGWMLVRRQKSGIGWMDNQDDNLIGKQEWGTIDGNITPTIDKSFSYRFLNIPFKEFLFMTGDGKKWLICDKSSVYEGWSNTLVKTKIKKSYISENPYEAVWCKRTGCKEDPWISARDHLYKNISSVSDSDEHSMLYGEGFQGWAYFLLNNQGCNVWIR